MHETTLPRRALITACGLAVALWAAACGAPLGGGSTATIDDSGEIVVRMTEYQFDPQDIVAPPGPLKITVVNDGTLPHNWKIYRGGSQVGGTETFPGGSTRTVFPDLEPGTYELRSTVGNNEFLGMRGTLTVLEEGPNVRRDLIRGLVRRKDEPRDPRRPPDAASDDLREQPGERVEPGTPQ